jgi:antitoxin HigA-1
MDHGIPEVHPGEILEEEFLKPLGISAYRLAKETRIPATRISQIIIGFILNSSCHIIYLQTDFGN